MFHLFIICRRENLRRGNNPKFLRFQWHRSLPLAENGLPVRMERKRKAACKCYGFTRIDIYPADTRMPSLIRRREQGKYLKSGQSGNHNDIQKSVLAVSIGAEFKAAALVWKVHCRRKIRFLKMKLTRILQSYGNLSWRESEKLTQGNSHIGQFSKMQ